jgi:uncharacterized protein YebE (UPF0316 family)
MESAVMFPTLPGWIVTFLIFLARIIDVSLGTIRILMVARGNRITAALLGFFEVLIWIMVIGQIMQNLTSWENYMAYAAGFAAGNYVGMSIERRVSLAHVMIRVIVPREAARTLIERLAETNYRFTHVDAEGSRGLVTIVMTVVRRTQLAKIIRMARAVDPKAYYTIEDVRPADQPAPHKHAWTHRWPLLQPFYWFRKGK